jgi:hypothetical protein
MAPTKPRRRRRRGAWGALLLLCCAATATSPLFAQADRPPRQLSARRAQLVWDSPARRLLYLSVGFRDAVDAGIREKLTRGLPTTVVMAATVYAVGRSDPVATTAQSCQIVWHVWEEAYRLEISRPGEHRQSTWTTTMEGVLRRCAEANRLLAGTHGQIPLDRALYIVGQVQINPISPQVLTKIQRWVSRPTGTGTAAPGDALFSTFTGLFLQRIGRAERQLQFRTRRVIPTVAR